MNLRELVRAVGRDAVARALGRDASRSDVVTVSRYANARQALSLTQAARLRRAFPELDLNEAAEALLVIEEERGRGEVGE